MGGRGGLRPPKLYIDVWQLQVGKPQALSDPLQQEDDGAGSPVIKAEEGSRSVAVVGGFTGVLCAAS